MTNEISNQKNLSKHISLLFWKALGKIQYLPLTVVFILIIVIIVLIIEFVNDDNLVFFGDKDLTLSILSSMLAGAIVFLLIELFTKIYLAGKKESTAIYYDEMFVKNGVEEIFLTRGINSEYEKRIKKAENRIWAIGMTNGNLIKHQLDNIISRITFVENIDVVISFWSATSSFTKAYETQKDISIINQQLHIEDKKTIENKLITNRFEQIKKKYISVRNTKSGKLKIVEMTLPSNFTCFIIDDDVFFFPFLSAVESTSSPIILCNINRGIGKEIYKHMKYVLSENEVTRVIYNSHNSK